MEEKNSEKKRNIVVYAMVGLAIAAIAVSSIAGSEQDAAYKQGAQQFQSAIQKMNQKDYSGAEKDLQNVITQYPDSFVVQWQYGASLAGQKKYQEANEWYVKARKQRPFLVQNQKYALQYGELLIHLQDYKKAERYLQEVQKLNKDPQLSAQATVLLQEVAAKTK
ncbi:tetratricopeptide repeat protein [Aneurinibacillus uraniidurans]|uniref:tetratricopeptide repeat protein n=1 Tax=Aneurinibacillus uraniidurans TaxID=2966586 RepID=UPI0023496B99|nr:tetratricopeptide repeat protein [Aneurinibacillus sp. B1]WCN38103.1 tetratricopeptide repeat protein [Aneurinibacillus sp. B1]